ncbi:MAG: TlpA family protein disulfide reductase [Defluviitaleaceae bacterium]|nr:TlpA family protein disulfide reductase [Defluviitaleaceae bacterium]MCL2836119.1 TlpA family protein disulfide reductase [Defluviitaleaceae bacterium]
MLKKVIIAITVFFCSFMFLSCDSWFDMLGNVSADAPTEVLTTADNETGSFPFEFTAEDIFGETVTRDDLSGKEIYFVHLWATWCGPCIAEMGELAEVAEMYADSVGFLGLLTDYYENRAGAARVAEANGVTFMNIPDRTPGLETVRQMVQSGFIPTTIIIDGAGNMIGGQLVGAKGLGYARYIEEALETVRSGQ